VGGTAAGIAAGTVHFYRVRRSNRASVGFRFLLPWGVHLPSDIFLHGACWLLPVELISCSSGLTLPRLPPPLAGYGPEESNTVFELVSCQRGCCEAGVLPLTGPCSSACCWFDYLTLLSFLALFDSCGCILVPLHPVPQTYNYGKDSYSKGDAYAQVAISTNVRS
jgi:hypothetical protein